MSTLKQEAETTRKSMTNFSLSKGMVLGSIIATPKDVLDLPHFIKIVPGECSQGNKEKVVDALDDYFNNLTFVPRSGYKDMHSSNIKDFLSRRFPTVDWQKNSSQRPFDLYSVEARVAIENKTKLVSPKKKTPGEYGVANKIPANATLYPTKVKVSEVVPKNKHKLYSEEVLSSYMDVIVTFVDRASDTNSPVRYAIVDGAYWGVTYEIFKGCVGLYNALNGSPLVRKAIFAILRIAAPKNAFVEAYSKGALPKVFLDLRKLINISNPTTEAVNG